MEEKTAVHERTQRDLYRDISDVLDSFLTGERNAYNPEFSPVVMSSQTKVCATFSLPHV